MDTPIVEVSLIQTIIQYVNYFVALLFIICYSYQIFYILVAFVRKPVKFKKTDELKRYAFLIAARNEEAVIANLVDSIKKQMYPTELIDVYVVADNCNDNTCDVARMAGAIVYERFNKEKVGKGYALDYLYSQVTEMCGDDYYDGYFVFDADNLLDKRYVSEMNKALCAGHKIITSYRNSKNYGSNWISAGYALWFMRESKHLNNARMILGTSCAVSGTGYLVSSEIMRRNNGWKFFLLTEDIEFSIDSILRGEKIAYCNTARYYDEQPTKFSTSWNQRIRWTKGYFQVFKKYGKDLLRGLFGTNAFSCFDMTMSILPAAVLSIFSVIVNIVTISLSIATGTSVLGVIWSTTESVINSALMMYALAILTTLSEWKEIGTTTPKKFLYILTFPIFMYTYIPIAIAAIFTKVQWKPIKHSVQMSIDEVSKGKKKTGEKRKLSVENKKELPEKSKKVKK
ncbi:MAG: glycosyltransferase family 2 protein [Eubacteriales bacterium]|nr:glycosyltransferase family 2 protein [Eubacteriales bacterium]